MKYKQLMRPRIHMQNSAMRLWKVEKKKKIVSQLHCNSENGPTVTAAVEPIVLQYPDM